LKGFSGASGEGMRVEMEEGGKACRARSRQSLPSSKVSPCLEKSGTRLIQWGLVALAGARTRLDGAEAALGSPRCCETQGEGYPSSDDNPSSERVALLAGHCHHDRSLPPSNVALEMKDLLPGAQQHFALGNRDRERRSEEAGLEMRVPVAIMPGLLVAVGTARGDELIENGGQVMLEPRFELDGADRRRAPDVEDVDDAALDCR